MAPQVVAISKGFIAVTAHKRCLSFMLFLYYRHRGPHSATAHIVGHIGRRLLVYLDGKDRFLVNRFSPSVKKWQQAVLCHLVLVVQGFISLLKEKRTPARLHFHSY